MELYITPSDRVYLEDLLISKSVSPPHLLVAHIQGLSHDVVLTVAMLLRDSPSLSNLYVDIDHSYGSVHIIVYLYSSQMITTQHEIITSLLHYSGSDIDSQAFTGKNETVREWLNNNNITYVPNIDDAIMLGRWDIIEPTTIYHTITIIRSHSNDKHLVNLIYTTEYDVLLECIKNYNAHAATQYISYGYQLSRSNVDVLLSHLNVNPSVTKRLLNILYYAMDNGLKVDDQQLSLITNSEIYNDVLKHSRSDILGYTSELFSGVEHSKIMKNLAFRQMARVGSRYGSPRHFTTTTPPTIDVSNLINAYDYVDEFVVFHMEDNKLYAWTSDQYQSLINSKNNPITQATLPLNILNEIQYKQSITSSISISPITWDQLYTMIN